MSEHWNDRYFPTTSQRPTLLAARPIKGLETVIRVMVWYVTTPPHPGSALLGSVIIIITLGGGTKVKITWLPSPSSSREEDNITITSSSSSFTDQSSVQIRAPGPKWWHLNRCRWSDLEMAPPFNDSIPDTKDSPVTHSGWWMLQMMILTPDLITFITKIAPEPSRGPRHYIYHPQASEIWEIFGSQFWSGCWHVVNMWISNGH